MADWALRALEALRSGTPCVLVSVLAVEGSTPREAGTRMTVTGEATFGSVGGGNLEHNAILQARAALGHAPGAWRIQDYPLGPLLAQCCGGRVRLMVERLDGDAIAWLAEAAEKPAFGLETRLYTDHVERRVLPEADGHLTARGPLPQAGDILLETVGQALTPLLMFGAGHVGAALARVLVPLPFKLAWFDTREAAADLSGVTVAAPETLAGMAEAANCPVLILTHDHQLDYNLCSAALRGTAPFIGVIGSATKNARFRSRLIKDGFDAELSRLHCPIGLPDLHGKAPEIIAVSVAAQLLLLSQDIH
jgi:xanthine dehydrogenase accessory factor